MLLKLELSPLLEQQGLVYDDDGELHEILVDKELSEGQLDEKLLDISLDEQLKLLQLIEWSLQLEVGKLLEHDEIMHEEDTLLHEEQLDIKLFDKEVDDKLLDF